MFCPCSLPRSRQPVSLNGCLGSTERGVGEGLAEKVDIGFAKGWRRVGKG